MERVLACVLAAFAMACGDGAEPPNVIVIVADDAGHSDFSAYGSTQFTTPNVDAIGEQGIRFTSAY